MCIRDSLYPVTISFRGFLLNRLSSIIYYGGAICFAHALFNICKNLTGNIFNPDKKCNRKIWVWQLFFFRHSPEPVTEIVVVNTAVRLDGTITTVVICKDKTL